jgi:hypothetical protein
MEKPLNLEWDKKEEKFSRKTRRNEVVKEGKKNVEEYIDFLTEIEPERLMSVRESTPDRYFVL